jgi:replicative DNA helicase
VASKRTPLGAPKRHDPELFVLPHNLEAERATLGAAMIQASAADYIADHLTEGAYFRRAHGIIYRAIAELRDKRIGVDYLTLRERLQSWGKLEDVGGPAELSGLADGIPRSSNVEYYAGILKDLQIKRALVEHSKRTIDTVAEASHSAQAILGDADLRLMELQAGFIEGRMQSLKDSAGAFAKDLEWRMEHRGEIVGVPAGFESIDNETLGWQRGDLIILAARPSIGKTAFVLNAARHAAAARNRNGELHRVALFSLEMKRIQLEYRMLASIAGVQLSRLLGGHCQGAEMARIAEAQCVMADLQIEIDDRSGQSFFDIRGACRRLKAEGGLDLVIIDYIQLMAGSLDRKGATRNDELADISRRLKVLGDEVDAPIIALSQLSRANEKRDDPRPKLSDLRESGALEQDADLVGFLHRKHHREGGVTNFIIEKARNGPGGTVNLTLDRETQTFTDGGEEPAEEPEKKRGRA